MKTIEVKEIEFTQEQDRFKVESYPSKGLYLVKQDKPKGFGGEIELFVVDDIGVCVLPNKAIELIKDSETKTQPKKDKIIMPQLNNQLTETFVLELVKIISSK